MHDGFGVGGSGEMVTTRYEIMTKLFEVVYFTVKNNVDAGILVTHRLVAGTEVDDSKPPMTKPNNKTTISRIRLKKALIIGPPVRDNPSHVV
jgi:hypothetical protein